MSFPRSGQLYLTGKVRLQNGCNENTNQNRITYDATVECRPTLVQHQFVPALFTHDLPHIRDSLEDGIYNLSCKVHHFCIRSYSSLIPFLRLSDFTLPCVQARPHFWMTTFFYMEKFLTFVIFPYVLSRHNTALTRSAHTKQELQMNIIRKSLAPVR